MCPDSLKYSINLNARRNGRRAIMKKNELLSAKLQTLFILSLLQMLGRLPKYGQTFRMLKILLAIVPCTTLQTIVPIELQACFKATEKTL